MLVPTPPVGDHDFAGRGQIVPQHQQHLYAASGVWLTRALRLNREETSARKELREAEQRDFSDMQFALSIMYSDMRRIREANHPRNVWAASSTGALLRLSAVGSEHREVWFPPVVPRGVPSPPRAIQQRIPKKVSQECAAAISEEEELRHWIVCLEAKLRDPIERACVDSWMLLTGPQRLQLDEKDARERIAADEEKGWTDIGKRFKHLTPASHYYYLIRAAKEAELARLAKDPEVAESRDRNKIEAEEVEERRVAFAWLSQMYGVRLYSTSRVEVAYRYEIEEQEEEEGISKQLMRQCEKEFRWSRLALTALHATKSPILVDFLQCCLSWGAPVVASDTQH